MLRLVDQFSDAERSLLRLFCRDCIIAIRGYDFQEGQAFVAFVVERSGQCGAGLPFAESSKRVAVSRQNLVAGADNQLHNGTIPYAPLGAGSFRGSSGPSEPHDRFSKFLIWVIVDRQVLDRMGKHRSDSGIWIDHANSTTTRWRPLS